MKDPRIFGAHYTPEETTFSLWAPGSSSVMLELYTTGSVQEEGNALIACIPMTKGSDDVFTAVVKGDQNGVYYTYQLTYLSGRETISADPWARASGVNGVRSMVVDLKKTDPEGWENDKRIGKSDMAPVIWETHVCDFSYDESSGVRPEWRGKYLGFTDKPRKVYGYHAPRGLAYVKDLGVTHIQLQPFSDFCTVDERTCKDYNWGYDQENYNIPEGSFSTDPYHGEVRIRECKQMIQAIHQAGLGVIMDVVYNHTYHKGSWLTRTAPGQYYRLGPDGSFMNASGCGTETASENWPFRNYMVQSILYWAQEYHLDGFRFDLMAIHDAETMNIIREELDKLPGGKDILLYGEPWSALPTAMKYPSVPANQQALNMLSDRIGIFSDRTRNFLSGQSYNARETGWSCGNAKYWQDMTVQSMLTGYCRSDLEHFAKVPGQIVHYVSCHDNFTLWDRLIAQQDSDDYDSYNEKAMQYNRLTSAMVLLSLGYSFFQSGEEYGRTKHGNGNTYKGPADENRLDWKRAAVNRKLVEWYRGLIAIRHEMYPNTEKELANKLCFLDAQYGTVAFTMPCRENGLWKEVLVSCNPYDKEWPLWLPGGDWKLLCDGENSELWKREVRTMSGKIAMKASSVMVFGR